MPKRPYSGSYYGGKAKKSLKSPYSRRSGYQPTKSWKPIIPFQGKQTSVIKRWGAPVAQFRPVAGLSSNALSITFSLAQVEGYTDFTGLYDQYRIRAVKCLFTPLSVVSTILQTSGAPQIQIPTLMTAIDYDDDTAPSTASVIRQYQTCHTHHYSELNKPHVRYFTPACLAQMYESVSATAYSPKFGQWIDMTDSATPHYGLKCLISTPSIATSVDLNCGYQIEVCYYLEFKNTR